MRIDVHAHYYPSAYLRLLFELGAYDEIPVFGLVPPPDLSMSVPECDALEREMIETRLTDMDAGGVDVQVLSLGLQPYFANVEKCVIAIGFINDLYKSLMKAHPGRFTAFGSVPLPHVPEAIDEIARCLDVLGLAGISLGCSAQGILLDDPLFEPIWAELDARNAVVYLHPGAGIVDSIPGCMDYHLAADFVSPAEVAITASRLVVTGLMRRYSNVSIILATLGGTLPFLSHRYDRGLSQEHPELHQNLGGFTEHLRRFHYDTSVIEEPAALRLATERFGADRILLGSDYSRRGVTTQRAVEYVMSAPFLSPADKHAILDANAYDLLRPTLPAGIVGNG